MPFYERLQSRSRRLFPTVAFGSILFPVFSFPCAGLAHGAGSPFEIELRELEREPEAVKKPEPAASSGKQADRKDARETGTDGTPPTGGYVRYTMRPGDHLYKVLTMRFGLSSAKAEALIPEIKRINGITDTSRLQIGQTILLPLSRKKRTVVVKPTPAPLPKPSRAPAPVEPPEQQAPAAESPPPFSKAERGIVRRAVAFWARLFPGSDSGSAGPETGETGSADIPVLTGIDGRKIRIISPADPPVFGNLSGADGKALETVVADPAHEKNFVLKLLQAAGFATTEGGAPLEFGSDPKLSITADYTAAKRVPGAEVRKTILVLVGENGCPAVSENLASYLEARNLRLVAWCGTPREVLSHRAVQVVFMPSGSVGEKADTVLATLPVKVSSDYPIEITVGQAGAPLGITVDRYFEREGRRCFVDFGESDQDRLTLFHLLELAGYRRISVAAGDDLRTLADRFSEALGLPSEYRDRVLVSIPDRHYALELPGILYQRQNDGVTTFFLTDMSPDQPFFDLLKVVQWGTQ